MRKIAFLLLALLCCWSCASVFAPQPGRVHGKLPGYRFALESCVGNKAEGKVYVTFTYEHRLAPQSLTLLSGADTYAADPVGNRYPVGYAGNQSVLRSAAGVPGKVTLEVRGVSPGIFRFSAVSCRVKASTQGVSGERSTVLLFRDVDIYWR